MNRSILLLPAPLSRFCQGSLSQQGRTKRREMQVSPHHYSQGHPGLPWLFLFSLCALSVPFSCYTAVKARVLGFSSPYGCYLYIPNPEFGFLTLSLPETNKILKLCFHLNSKENPRSENFWHILQRNFLFAIPWYQLQ